MEILKLLKEYLKTTISQSLVIDIHNKTIRISKGDFSINKTCSNIIIYKENQTISYYYNTITDECIIHNFELTHDKIFEKFLSLVDIDNDFKIKLISIIEKEIICGNY